MRDTLRLSRSSGSIRMTCNQKGLPVDSSNLVVRALDMLQKKLGIKEGMRVHLNKKIPMGAGLGGGSSDAAAALLGGWTLWKKKNDIFKKPKRVPPVLQTCAKMLGADVAFFLKGGTAWAEGVGERLTPMKKKASRWMVLVYPHVHVATPLAYRLLDKARKKSREENGGDPLSWRARPASFRQLRSKNFFNSFEPVILRSFPEIKKAKTALVSLGGEGVMMSGSGSTVFGFARNKIHARRMVQALNGRKWQVFLCQTV